MIAAILPWPARAERRAAVEAARQGAAEAQQKAVRSRSLVDELHELRQKNHISEALDQIVARRAREQQ